MLIWSYGSRRVWINSKSTGESWLDIAADHGFECKIQAQDIKLVTSVGWLKYVAKHGAKSVHAAQRENLPAVGWETPGRVWGYGPRSAWPSKATREPMRFDLPQPAFWRLQVSAGRTR